MIPFVDTNGTPCSYYSNPVVIGSRVILRNGAVLEGIRDSKRFSRDFPVCSDDTPSKLRTWYRNFCNHALSCGYFMVPYELLSKHHGGSTGFEFGIDLPQAKITKYSAWQSDIGRVLQHSSTFPVKSKTAQRAATNSNGYDILLAIVSNSHPGFMDQSILLAMNFLTQQPSQDIFEFYHVFLDVIRLRAIFMGGTDDMKSNHMIDCFIQSCRQSLYLTQVSRFDRTDPLKKHTFEAGALAITLTNYLAGSDSPSKPIIPVTPPAAPTPHRNPYHCHVCEVIREENPSAAAPSTLTSTDLDNHHDAVIRELRAHDPSEAPICALCKTKSHRFKECPLLNDETFLRGFTIRMCTTVSKELCSGKHRLANPTDNRIHAMLHEPTEPIAPPDTTPSPLFPPGGI
jgi:hypothetical protein